MTAVQGSLVRAQYCVTACDILYRHKSEPQRGSWLSSTCKKEEKILVLNFFHHLFASNYIFSSSTSLRILHIHRYFNLVTVSIDFKNINIR